VIATLDVGKLLRKFSKQLIWKCNKIILVLKRFGSILILIRNQFYETNAVSRSNAMTAECSSVLILFVFEDFAQHFWLLLGFIPCVSKKHVNK